MRQKQKFKKRHFQLLEIMVALLLIVGCAVPVMHIYFNMYKKQDSMTRDFAIDHIAHLQHANIVERLYKNILTFDDLNGKEFPLDDEEANKELADLGYSGVYTLTAKKPKKNETKSTCDLIISMKDMRDGSVKHYDYLLCITGGPKPENQDGDDNQDQTDGDGKPGKQAS